MTKRLAVAFGLGAVMPLFCALYVGGENVAQAGLRLAAIEHVDIGVADALCDVVVAAADNEGAIVPGPFRPGAGDGPADVQIAGRGVELVLTRAEVQAEVDRLDVAAVVGDAVVQCDPGSRQRERRRARIELD